MTGPTSTSINTELIQLTLEILEDDEYINNNHLAESLFQVLKNESNFAGTEQTLMKNIKQAIKAARLLTLH